MEEPLVSICMITYNHEPYIRKSIECVLAQETKFPFELVIGEDCSADGTREIVFDYQKKYPDIIKVITSNKNVGAHKNSLRTEKACRGKYIALCDGDDYWHHPRKLQKQVDYLESHPEYGLVYSDFRCFYVKSGRFANNDPTYKSKTNIIPNDPVKVLTAMLRGEFSILTCTVCLRKDLLDDLIASDPFLYTGGHFLSGDTQMWAGFSQITRLAYIDESLATHNVLVESAAHSKDVTKYLRIVKSGAELKLYLAKKYGLPEAYQKNMQERIWNLTMKLAFHEKNAKLAEEVKKSKKNLTFMEWLQYWGSKSTFLSYALGPLVCLRRSIRRMILHFKLFYIWK